MKRWPVVVVVALAGAGAAGWLLLRGTTVELSLGEAWPDTVRAVGEGLERIHASADGSITEGDRARAAERARWKAYYNAQLRLAEQLGGLMIDASTTIEDAGLVDQELRAVCSETVNAAAEVEAEGSVEDLGDAVRAVVVVEAPAEGVASLREAVGRVLASGRMTVRRDAPARPAPAEEAEGTVPPAAEDAVAAGRPRGDTGEDARPAAPAARSGGSRGRAVSTPQPTGCAVLIDGGGVVVGVAPDFFDGAGTLIGSSLDLTPERRLAGLVVASSLGDELVAQWAGARPMELRATVSRNNVVLEEVLTPDRARFFRESLVAGRVVLVLGLDEEG